MYFFCGDGCLWLGLRGCHFFFSLVKLEVQTLVPAAMSSVRFFGGMWWFGGGVVIDLWSGLILIERMSMAADDVSGGWSLRGQLKEELEALLRVDFVHGGL